MTEREITAKFGTWHEPRVDLQPDEFLVDHTPFTLTAEHVGKRPVLAIPYTRASMEQEG